MASGSGCPLWGTQDTFSLAQQMRETEAHISVSSAQHLDLALCISHTTNSHPPVRIQLPVLSPDPYAVPKAPGPQLFSQGPNVFQKQTCIRVISALSRLRQDC